MEPISDTAQFLARQRIDELLIDPTASHKYVYQYSVRVGMADYYRACITRVRTEELKAVEAYEKVMNELLYAYTHDRDADVTRLHIIMRHRAEALPDSYGKTKSKRMTANTGLTILQRKVKKAAKNYEARKARRAAPAPLENGQLGLFDKEVE